MTDDDRGNPAAEGIQITNKRQNQPKGTKYIHAVLLSPKLRRAALCCGRCRSRLPSGRCFILGRALGLDMLRHESPVCSRPSFDQRLRIVHERVRQRIAAYVADRQGLTLPGPNETTNYKLPIPFKSTPRPTIKARKRDRERAERILSAGGPKPSLRERAVALVRERGTVRTRDLTDIGIPRCYLARMCDEGLLIKVSYGIYRATDKKAS